MARLPLLLLLLLTFTCRSQNNIPVRPYQIPHWAKGIVWYQIFPERFRNGDTANDPRAGEVPRAERYGHWQVHPWNSDWFEVKPYERSFSDRFYDVVYQRRYGGDLIGVMEKLDYLQDLGIDAIYFNPLFEAPSLHKYDGATFHHIDNNFGRDSRGDLRRLATARETEDPSTWIWTSADSVFLELIHEAHKRHIRIVIDGVFNHTGTAFFAFKDVLEKGKASRYADWYDVTAWDDPETPTNEFDYKGWWGVKGLPEFYEDENGFRPAVWDYIFHATKRWMDPDGDGDPSDGIDGWRLDAADQVAPVFWKKWYARVKALNPQALIVAELWDDASGAVKDARFDGAMNYPFAYAMTDYFIDRATAISSDELARRLTALYHNYGKQTLNVLWNLIDSHDTDRVASMILNPDLNFDRQRSPKDNPDYVLRKPDARERRIQKQIAAFQMTFPGAPLIYYGTEAGMWGSDDPDDRKPMLWDDMDYDNEKHHPLPGHSRPDDANYFDRQLFNYYRSLIALRKHNPALQTGDFQVARSLTDTDLFAFYRRSPEQTLLVVFNRSDTVLPLKQPVGTSWRVVHGSGTSTVPARGFMVLEVVKK